MNLQSFLRPNCWALGAVFDNHFAKAPFDTRPAPDKKVKYYQQVHHLHSRVWAGHIHSRPMILKFIRSWISSHEVALDWQSPYLSYGPTISDPDATCPDHNTLPRLTLKYQCHHTRAPTASHLALMQEVRQALLTEGNNEITRRSRNSVSAM